MSGERTIEGDAICHDCGAKPGENHVPGCDVERCSFCGGQWIACGHEAHDPDTEYWTGAWPGMREAVERGWFTYWEEANQKWVRCAAEHPEATPDLTRYAFFRMCQLAQERERR